MRDNEGDAEGRRSGAAPARAGWRFHIDRGGTFTDVIGVTPEGGRRTLKLPSAGQAYADAAVEGMRRLLGVPAGAAFPAEQVAEIRLGTTVATNALLERTGAPTLWVTTAGFADALLIGDQARPDLFALSVVRPAPLYAAVVEATERLDAGGAVVTPLDEAALAAALRAARPQGLTSCAISFLHADLNPEHELTAGRLAVSEGFELVTLSHQASPLPRFLPRARTAVADAYLTPVLQRYVRQVAAAVGDAPLWFMTSAGALVRAESFRGKDAVVSGPAGGVLGVAATAAEAGGAEGPGAVLGFDMGGTSTDVCRYAGALERRDEAEAAGVKLRAPMLDVETVAAGGGSVLAFDGLRARVGPHSAGADPGPAAYGRGGPATVTDANLVLGRLLPARFPAMFGAGNDAPLDVAAARGRLDELATAMGAESAEAAAEGFLAVAVEQMAAAVRRVSTARGYDPRDHALVAFGGAAGQVACDVAAALGVREVLCPRYGSLLSAFGIGAARARALRQAGLEQPLDAAGLSAAETLAGRLRGEAEAALAEQGVAAGAAETRLALHYEGVDAPLTVRAGPPAEVQAAFEAAHRRLFGFVEPDRPVLIASVEVEVAEAVGGSGEAAGPLRPASRSTSPMHGGGADQARRQAPPPPAGEGDQPQAGGGGAAAAQPMIPSSLGLSRGPMTPLAHGAPASSGGGGSMGPRHKAEGDGEEVAGAPARLFHHGDWVEAAVIEAEGLRAAEGPAVIVRGDTQIVLPPGWSARGEPSGLIRLTASASAAAQPAADLSRPDPVTLELFNRRFMSVAEAMGAALERTAQSVNIKERLDFSCALFDPEGGLVANAPHMPVHLGSMGASVRAVRARHPELRSGDAFALNNPYAGGTHLPDITVVMPIFTDGPAPAFYVAARGHHADVGGAQPGSMPPFSRTVDEEGVLLDALPVMRDGAFLEAEVRGALTAGPQPARAVARNLGDLKAQIAACQAGAEQVRGLLSAYGAETVVAYMGFVQDNAEESVRRALSVLEDGAAEVPMDGGGAVRVQVTVDRAARSAVLDFTGSGDQLPSNFNAPAAIVDAASLYVFRTLVDDDIPLNAGCLKPLEIRTRAGSLLRPEPPAAVVAGNVETSQHVTDALYAALGVMANSQGSMNNFTYGDGARQYYETICGGVGATAAADGASAVHSHMTNSRLTDPEILERRLPVRLERFGVRHGSGGAAARRGGDGAVRRLRFLEPLEAALLSTRREHAPKGLAGGGDGASGAQVLIRADGTREPLPGRFAVSVAAGEAIEIETPGGGGYGPPEGEGAP